MLHNGCVWRALHMPARHLSTYIKVAKRDSFFMHDIQVAIDEERNLNKTFSFICKYSNAGLGRRWCWANKGQGEARLTVTKSEFPHLHSIVIVRGAVSFNCVKIRFFSRLAMKRKKRAAESNEQAPAQWVAFLLLIILMPRFCLIEKIYFYLCSRLHVAECFYYHGNCRHRVSWTRLSRVNLLERWTTNLIWH